MILRTCEMVIVLWKTVRFRYTRVRYRNIKNHFNFYKLFFFTELILLVYFMVIMFVLIKHLNSCSFKKEKFTSQRTLRTSHVVQ